MRMVHLRIFSWGRHSNLFFVFILLTCPCGTPEEVLEEGPTHHFGKGGQEFGGGRERHVSGGVEEWRELESDATSQNLNRFPLLQQCSHPLLPNSSLHDDLPVLLLNNAGLFNATWQEALPCRRQNPSTSVCHAFLPGEGECEGVARLATGGRGAPGLFVLRDVHVSLQGHVFNSSHLIFAPETASQEFLFLKGSGVVKLDQLVYVLPPESAYTVFEGHSIGTTGSQGAASSLDEHAPLSTSQHRHQTYRHIVEGLLPAVFSLAPVLRFLKERRLLAPHSAVMRGVAGFFAGPGLSSLAAQSLRATLVGHHSPTLFVRTLFLPFLPSCSHPTSFESVSTCPHVWRPIRTRHLVAPRGLPMLNAGWVLRGDPLAVEPSPDENPPRKLPDDWVVVLAFKGRRMGVPGSTDSDESVREAVRRWIPAERIVEFDSHTRMRDVKDLFNRAVLVVGHSSLALTNLIFMPFNASVIELCAPHRCTDDFESWNVPPAPLPVSFRHLASSCGLHWRGLMCVSTAPKEAGDRARPALTVDCSGKIAELEHHLRNAIEYLQLPLPDAAASAAELGASQENLPSSSVLQETPEELSPEVWDAAYNETRGTHRTHTVLYRLSIPGLEETLPEPVSAFPGTKLVTAAEASAFLSWQRCVARYGRWERNGTPRALPWEYTGYYNTCDVRWEQEEGLVAWRADEAVEKGVGSEEWNVRETLKYEWRVPEGRCVEREGKGGWRRMDGRDLCRLGAEWKASQGKGEGGAKGLYIMMVGDSMQQQFAQTFMNMLLWHVKKPATWVVNKTVCYDWVPHGFHEHCTKYVVEDHPEVCPGGLTLLFVSNRWLTIGEADVAKESVPWFETRGLVGADVIIINRGAHYTDDVTYEKDVKRAINFIRRNFKDKLLVYRTTPPGHANCTWADGPLEKPLDPTTLPYNWGEFLHQNDIAVPLVRRVGGVVLDVVPLMSTRADGHRSWREMDNINLDCLHYCTPGPPDVWTEYLYNSLLWLLSS